MNLSLLNLSGCVTGPLFVYEARKGLTEAGKSNSGSQMQTTLAPCWMKFLRFNQGLDKAESHYNPVLLLDVSEHLYLQGGFHCAGLPSTDTSCPGVQVQSQLPPSPSRGLP